MGVSRPAEARQALTLIGAVFLGQALLLLVSTGLTQLLLRSDRFSALDAWFMATSVLWLLAGCAEVWAFFELSRALRPAPLVYVVLGSAALLTLSSVFWLVGDLFPSLGVGRTPAPVGVALVLVGLVEALAVCALIGKLGRSTAFAAGLAAFALVRSLTSLALTLRGPGAEPLPEWTYGVRTLLGMVVLGGVGALALHARSSVARAAGLPEQPLTEPIVEASGMRQVIAGVVLLVLGVGGTALSYAVASSGSGGGRYVIATGAIAAGLVQLARGISRLGR